MTPTVRFRREVPDDLLNILNYLTAHSPAAADRFAEAVAATFEDLARMPGKGSPKHFRNARLSGIRSWAVPGFPNHLILYQPIPGGIEVWAVSHGARNLPALLRKRIGPTGGAGP